MFGAQAMICMYLFVQSFVCVKILNSCANLDLANTTYFPATITRFSLPNRTATGGVGGLNGRGAVVQGGSGARSSHDVSWRRRGGLLLQVERGDLLLRLRRGAPSLPRSSKSPSMLALSLLAREFRTLFIS